MRTIMKKALLGLSLGVALVGAARAQTIGAILDGPYSLPILAKTTTYSGSFNGTGPALVRVNLSAPNILTTGTLVLNGTQIMQASDFNAPASITITANAADSDGTVAKVEFFEGATLLGTATVVPYSERGRPGRNDRPGGLLPRDDAARDGDGEPLQHPLGRHRN